MEIKVLIFKEGDWYVAQGLEHDIGAQARDVEELKGRFAVTVAAEEILSRECGFDGLNAIEPAPQEFWDRYDQENAHRWVYEHQPKEPDNG